MNVPGADPDAALKLAEKVKKLLLEILDVEEREIVPSAHYMTDLGASSVDFAEILAAVENEFGVRISDAEAARMLTVQATIDHVVAKSTASRRTAGPLDAPSPAYRPAEP